MPKQLSPQQIHDGKELLRFFEAIPDEKWCKGDLHNGDKSCAMGHMTWCSLYYRNGYVLFYELVGRRMDCVNDDPGHPKYNIVNALKKALGL